jgi:hypothetical protein
MHRVETGIGEGLARIRRYFDLMIRRPLPDQFEDCFWTAHTLSPSFTWVRTDHPVRPARMLCALDSSAADLLKASDSRHDCARWLTFYKWNDCTRENIETGMIEDRSLHIPEHVTPSSRRRSDKSVLGRSARADTLRANHPICG